MAIEQQIADAIVLAFDDLGGKPQDAIRKALYHRTVADFVSDETTKVALAGGAEMIIPGTQLLTIPLGISYLLHKMATIAWGIGGLKGAVIIETAHYSDLRNVLSLYANDTLYNGTLLSHQAVHKDAYAYAISSAGYARLQQVSESSNRVDLNARTWEMLRQLAEEYPTDERAYLLLKMVADAATADAAREAAVGRYVTQEQPVDVMGRRVSGKLALKLAAQISARVPARLIMGFVPIAGAVLNAYFNTQMLRDFAQAAESYYNQPVQQHDLEMI